MTLPRSTSETPEVGEVRFTIAYDGPALANGRMALLDLAPAMLSTARLVEDGVRLLYGSSSGVKIEVNADFQHGSFAFDVFATPLLQGEISDALSRITPQDIDLALKWLGLTGGAGGGVFGLIKWLRRRKIKAVERDKASDSARIVVHDGDSITVNIHVATLTLNQTIREHADGVVRPLRSPGITDFSSGVPGEPPTVVREPEVEYFEPPPPPERQLQDKATTEVLEVVGISFREGNKWRFSQGEQSFHAAVLDADFLRRVDRHEYTFGKGDALVVTLRTVVTQGPEGLSAMREVIKVHDKISAPTQGDLFADSPYSDA